MTLTHDLNLNFRAFFAYFDEKKCRWVEEENICEENVADYNATVSGETNSYADSGESVSDNNTDTLDVSSIVDVTDAVNTSNMETVQQNSDPAIITTQIPLYQNLECESLDDTWICSSGSKHLSLCIKFCTIGIDLLDILKTQSISCLSKSKSFVLQLNRKKMVLLKTKNVCASKINALGPKKV